MKPRTPIKRVNSKRRASEFKRCYGSKERVAFVRGLACAACGVVGYSENAHVAPASEKGTGYKAGYIWIAPLCGTRPDVEHGGVWLGCHPMYDRYPWAFDAPFPGFDAEKAAAETEKLWLSSQLSKQ